MITLSQRTRDIKKKVCAGILIHFDFNKKKIKKIRERCKRIIKLLCLKKKSMSFHSPSLYTIPVPNREIVQLFVCLFPTLPLPLRQKPSVDHIHVQNTALSPWQQPNGLPRLTSDSRDFEIVVSVSLQIIKSVKRYLNLSFILLVTNLSAIVIVILHIM